MESFKSQFQKKAGKEKRKQNDGWKNNINGRFKPISTITLNIKV